MRLRRLPTESRPVAADEGQTTQPHSRELSLARSGHKEPEALPEARHVQASRLLLRTRTEETPAGSGEALRAAVQEVVHVGAALGVVAEGKSASRVGKAWNRFAMYLVNCDESKNLSYPPPTR